MITSQIPASAYEFEALGEAHNYRNCILTRFSPYLHGHVLEVGAGIGQFTQSLLSVKAVNRLSVVEPDKTLAPSLLKYVSRNDLFPCYANQLPEAVKPHVIVSINVMEHVEDDAAEFREYARRLAPASGYLCIFVPAGSSIYAEMDARFGHFRRYDRQGLVEKMRDAGFIVEQCHYLNFPGFFLWWLEFKIMKRNGFNPRKVAFFDKYLFPLIAFAEKLVPPPLGQSIIAVARITNRAPSCGTAPLIEATGLRLALPDKDKDQLRG